jgi:hypothetical protein
MLFLKKYRLFSLQNWSRLDTHDLKRPRISMNLIPSKSLPVIFNPSARASHGFKHLVLHPQLP